jgi:uncharacterized protein (TIGR03086 family)
VTTLVGALELQLDVVQLVPADGLDLMSRCDGWTIREVLNHSLGVTRKFADFASGVTDEPHSPPGDLLGQDHRAAMRSTVNQAGAAWRTADMSRTCRLTFGAFPAEAVVGINLFDALAHTWDIAATIRVDLDVHADLWTSALDAARAIVGASRDPEHYAPEIQIRPTAPPMHRFLAFLGRRLDDRP